MLVPSRGVEIGDGSRTVVLLLRVVLFKLSTLRTHLGIVETLRMRMKGKAMSTYKSTQLKSSSILKKNVGESGDQGISVNQIDGNHHNREQWSAITSRDMFDSSNQRHGYTECMKCDKKYFRSALTSYRSQL